MKNSKKFIPLNKTMWTDKMIVWLKANFDQYTNPQMAEYLKVTLTVFRNKTRELGLRKIEMEYWGAAELNYLIENYKTTGDVEIALYLQKHFPKNKRWTKNHICKKRKYLKFQRSPEQLKNIISKNCSPGGRSYTIEQNSSSKNMHDGWVANQIAWRNKKLAGVIKTQYPELIHIKRKQIQLNQLTKQK